jgi:beta-1,4-mannosyltransferase
LDDLMTAYGELDSASVSLQIVGEPQNADLVARLTSFAEGRRRVRLCLRHVADITLSRAITESSVVVLPYRQMHNSGALILALSLGAVVLAPQTPTTLLVQEEVGAEWVQLFSGEHITAADLVDALEAAATVDVARRPRFRDRDPSVVAERHLQVYRSVLGTQDLPAVGKDCIT